MEYVIWLPLVVILGFGFLGFRDGIVKRVLEIAGIILTVILAGRFATEALPWMQDRTGLPEGPALLITWAALFFVGFIVAKLLAALVSKLIRLTILGWVDKWGGALIGVLIGILFCSVVLVALDQITGDGQVQAAYEESTAGKLLFHAAPGIYRSVQGLSGGRAGEVWDRVLDRSKEEADKIAEDVQGAAKDAAEKHIEEKIDETKEQIEEKINDAKDAVGG
jgi:membrane protein required for colicin V production